MPWGPTVTRPVATNRVKTSVFVGTSLDGFIARSDGALDWLPPGGGEPHGYDDFISTVDVIVIGRHTFETVLAFPAWPYTSKQVIVLTSNPSGLRAPEGARCEFMSARPADVVAHLTARGFTHAYVDGGLTIQRFLAAGYVQSLVITRVPVLLGSGIPLFGPVPADIRFTHVATHSYPSGLVTSEYIRQS